MMLVPSRRSNDFFNDFFNDPFDMGFFSGRPQKQPMPSMMKTDIKETDKGYELEIDLPGFKKENVHAELKDGYLTVNATTDQSSEEKNSDGSYLRKERFTGSCSRSFYVGDEISEDEIRAKFEDGILKIDIPKKVLPTPEETKKLISIEG